MTTRIDDRALEALLEGDAHVDDAGFSDRVVERLPRRRRVRRREVILACSALAAAAVGTLVWLGSDGAALEQAGTSWVHAAAVAMAVGLGLWGALGAAHAE
ncbi:MAG: hypothetical protein A2138_02185 [Deltaproteobacteria bacterium RBG_16_71_12]|nr:MAG: hypothetical protein A2138_02185 [Deltaproteobacteria bacterium RBG_16_71_12]